MQRLRQWLQRTVYVHGWETRCRNLPLSRQVKARFARSPVENGPQLLDVGSGSLGLAVFLPGLRVVGTDLAPPVGEVAASDFRLADITELPFESRSFPAISCVDVLEHLPLEARKRAISELVRVTGELLLIACPHGEGARDCDESFRQMCERRGRPLESWVAEHQGQEYPSSTVIVEQVRDAARALGRTARVAVAYNEPIALCRLVRAAAARSRVLYVGTNLILGALMPLVPTPSARDSYRMILTVELS
jgi:hypothetical protein